MKKAQARKIKSYLVEKGVLQRAIARECNVSDSLVYKVIKDPDIVISRRVAEAICAKIRKPLNEVFPAYQPKKKAA